MAVVNNNIIVCTEFHEGRVYEYNSKADTTKMVLQDLRHPSYISVDHTPQGPRYILSLEGQSVNIYDETWQLQTTIKLRYVIHTIHILFKKIFLLLRKTVV